MSSGGKCPECGTAIPTDSPGGFCAQCLLGLGLGNAGDPSEFQPEAKEPSSASLKPATEPGDIRNERGVAGPLTEKAGDRIGRYRLLEEIGHGGCGVVYMAQQEEPVRRRVALKVIKLGMDTEQVVARFEAERQALALMDHPNIAKVLDAGATDTGRPFFVMELVGGIKLTDYCDQHQLSASQRLELFVQVCRAIQHAHHKGVIHRDIKPSNVLVATQDGVPVPKVIDFGIAKATEGRLTDQTVFTAFEQFLGTPAYMSPEQAQLGGVDVDTRSDIYSLGVLLYELLTGKTPFDTREMLAGGLDAICRTIREKEPARPSTRLSTMGVGELRTAAERRQSDPPKLIHLVRGDLDWIVMKCLEKDRARRYETANGLAKDIERHLGCEPVLARPPSRLYEFQKTVRRHKFGFAATAAIIAVLAVAAAYSTWQAREQSRLRQEAQAAREDARDKLCSAYLSEARALRFSGRSGQHFNGLAALRQAAAIRPSPALRNEAVACMVLADARLLGRRDFTATRQQVVGDVAQQKYAVLDRTGGVSIRRVSDDAELGRLPPLGAAANGVAPFSPDGRFLALHYADNRWRAWDWAKPVIVADVASAPEGGATFTPDSKAIAISDATNVLVHDLATGEKLQSISLQGRATPRAPGWLRFDPSGQRLGVFTLESGTNVLVLDVRSGEAVAVLPHQEVVYEVAWHPDGRHLAVACAEGFIYLWDSNNGSRIRKWRCESSVSVGFSRRGDILASSGWDGKTRLWEFPSGRQLVSINLAGHILGFAADDRRLTLLHWDGAGLEFLETIAGLGLRTLQGEPELSAGPGGTAIFSPNGRFVGGMTMEGIGLWDVQTGRRIAMLHAQGDLRCPIGFDASGTNLILTGAAGLYRWPLPEAQAGFGPAILMNRACADPLAGRSGAVSADGTVCGVVGNDRCQIFRTDNLALQAETAVQPGMRYIAISPDGLLVATSAWQRSDVKVWDGRTGELVKDLVANNGSAWTATLAFTPDGGSLVTSFFDESAFWEVGSWSRSRRIPQEPGNDFPATMAFSRDGKIFAGTHTRNVVRLFDAASGAVLADLEAPNCREITALSFNHDGTLLAACESRDALRIWDLGQIRRKLSEIGLDWDLPRYSPAPAKPLAARAGAPQNSARH